LGTIVRRSMPRSLASLRTGGLASGTYCACGTGRVPLAEAAAGAAVVASWGREGAASVAVAAASVAVVAPAPAVFLRRLRLLLVSLAPEPTSGFISSSAACWLDPLTDASAAAPEPVPAGSTSM